MNAWRGLPELRALRQALQDAAAQARRDDADARERAAREQHERELFARSVGPVQPLRHAARAALPRPRPAPLARQRALDDAAVLREAIGDGVESVVDAESLLDTDDALSWRRDGVGADAVRKLRRGVWVTQAQLDLHGLRRDEARARLAAFLREAAAAGWRCVRIVHGKGLGSPGGEPVLKAMVKGWLARQQGVLAFTHARACDGGHGALMVLLRAPVRHATGPRRRL